MSREHPELIDWGLADRVARAFAGNGTGKRSVRKRGPAEGLARQRRAWFATTPASSRRGRLPAAEVIDRREWIEANLDSLRAMSAGVEDGLSRSLQAAGAARLGPARRRRHRRRGGARPRQRLPRPARAGPVRRRHGRPRPPARLLFVAPNLADAQKRLGAEREPFLRWIALHEATHVVQFAAVPWLRDHIGGTAEKLLAGAFAGVSLGELAAALRKLLTPDPRADRRRGPRRRVALALHRAGRAAGWWRGCRRRWPSSRATPSTSWTRSGRSSTRPSASCASGWTPAASSAA